MAGISSLMIPADLRHRIKALTPKQIDAIIDIAHWSKSIHALADFRPKPGYSLREAGYSGEAEPLSFLLIHCADMDIQKEFLMMILATSQSVKSPAGIFIPKAFQSCSRNHLVSSSAQSSIVHRSTLGNFHPCSPVLCVT